MNQTRSFNKRHERVIRESSNVFVNHIVGDIYHVTKDREGTNYNNFISSNELASLMNNSSKIAIQQNEEIVVHWLDIDKIEQLVESDKRRKRYVVDKPSDL